jgi:hypothetical protein
MVRPFSRPAYLTTSTAWFLDSGLGLFWNDTIIVPPHAHGLPVTLNELDYGCDTVLSRLEHSAMIRGIWTW